MSDDMDPITPPPDDGGDEFDYKAWLDQAGIDPTTTDPQHVGAGVTFWNGLNHRDTAAQYAESLMQQRGYIPEGMSLADVQAWAESQQEAGDPDPWEQFEVQDDETGDDGSEYNMEEYRQPAPFDPNSLRPVFESEGERIKREVLEQVAQQQAQQRSEEEFRSELDWLRKEHHLPQSAAFGVMVQANDLAQTMPNASLRERAEKAMGDYQREVDGYIAERAKQQAEVNKAAKSIPTGPPPADRQPVGSLEELLEREVGSGS